MSREILTQYFKSAEKKSLMKGYVYEFRAYKEYKCTMYIINRASFIFLNKMLKEIL